MTTDISIKNFQSIKNVDFKIDGFTVIVGKNNIGKSAVIRAIESALTNQAGKEFIRHGEKYTEVKISKDDLNIEWKKGASATYKVNDDVFSKLNRAIPQPLIDAGYEKMDIGNQKISPIIASQFETLFLINENGGTVTEVLAALYKIDTLSTADDLCQRVLRSQKSLLKTRDSDLKVLQEGLEKYKDFEETKNDIDALVKKDIELQAIAEQIAQLNKYETELVELATYIKTLAPLTEVKIPDSKKLEKNLKEVQWLKEKDKEFSEVSSSINLLKQTEIINIPDTKNLEQDIAEVQWLREKDNELKKLNSSLSLLKQVKSVKVPNISKINVEEIHQFREWEETITKSVQDIKAQKAFLANFNLDDILSDMAITEVNLEEFTKTKSTETAFIKTVTEAKKLREEFRSITAELEEKQFELAEIKICPTCERPL